MHIAQARSLDGIDVFPNPKIKYAQINWNAEWRVKPNKNEHVLQ